MPVVHVIDDASAILQVTDRGLTRYGYQVRTFESALAYLGEEPECPDLLITDLMMTGMNGIAFCEQLRDIERYEKVPIVVITGMADRSELMSDEALMRDYGVRAVVTKPFSLRDLRAQVELVLTPPEVPAEDDFEITVDAPDDGSTSHLLLFGFDDKRKSSLAASIDILRHKRAGNLFGDDLASALVDWLGLQERMTVRVAASSKVVLHVGELVAHGDLNDVSLGGVRVDGVHEGALPSPGMGVSISFALKGYGEVTQAQGFVRWLRPESDGLVSVGVSFARPVPDQVRDLISAYVEEAAGHDNTQKFTPLFRSQ